jgi:3-oxoacyl-[acyl-carrier protein] reductase
MKTVFITGCNRGIGRHLIEMFYAKGYQVAGCDIDITEILELVEALEWDKKRYFFEPIDVSDSSRFNFAVEKTVEKYGKIDIFINNAGVIVPGFVSELQIKDIDNQIDVNLRGVIYGSRLATQQMLKQGHGHIINIASLAGVAPIYGLPVYSATKTAVRAFTIAMANELHHKNIKVSCICPDLVATNMLTQQLDYKAAALTFSGNKPLQVEDIADAIFERALGRNELEVMIPRSRGFLGKIGNLFPRLGFSITRMLEHKGLQKQQILKDNRIEVR